MRRVALIASVACASACGAPPADPQQKTYESFAPPLEGIQVETQPWMIPAGVETTECLYVKVPTAVEMDVVAFESSMRPGSHHMIVFLDHRNSYPDGVRHCDIEDMTTVEWGFAAQTTQASMQFPANVAMRIGANQQLVIQAHFLNAGDTTLNGQIKVNFRGYPTGTKRFIRAAALVGFNLNIRVPVGGTQTTSATCIPSSSRDLRMVNLSSHTHRHATLFTADFYDGARVDRELFRTTDWAHPEFVQFSPPIYLEPGQGFRYTCTFRNDTDHVLVFANQQDQEMCMLLGYYYPADGNILCLN